MAKWLVETKTTEEIDELCFQLGLEVIEKYPDGSIIVNCPLPEDENDLVEYCEDLNIELKLS